MGGQRDTPDNLLQRVELLRGDIFDFASLTGGTQRIQLRSGNVCRTLAADGCQPMPTFLQDFLGLTAVATRQARNAAFLQPFPSP